MLDAETRRRIDTARDILVGKVPDPKSQVEQITIALIYKFMDDMDAESEELGGKRNFFAGEFARYGWPKLMHAGLGGHETLNLYAEAIAKMPENPGIPLLFREIFKNAYLPYRDPETLRAFLKIINEFEYDHSERLGDAFEYLLSVLGSQGDAGQFRTPRHIIDFIVRMVDPKKNETVLDPACGTAGFLISSYKHILKANTDARGHSTLTPDERKRLADNFRGYDISPDMVRLSLVNMYLHGFVAPHIYEYDTLTSQERWNEYADVILANPPFMSPKGGIRPHNRFTVESKRSEVLFVDYIAEHLTPTGRAGVIVPEGVIFQSQNAYKQLRKLLVDGSLVAVISLPAGVFNPYSGVKTSILILDKALAKKSAHIAFFKVESDGFDLGAQRRPSDKDDLPQVSAELGDYLRRLRSGEPVDALQPTTGLIVAKEKVAENGDYNLSGERYRENEARNHAYPLVSIGEICKINPPKSELANLSPDTRVSFVPMADMNEHRISFQPKEEKSLAEVTTSYTYFRDGDVLFAKVTPCFENGKAGIAQGLVNGIGFGSSEFYVLRAGEQTLPEWLYFCVMHPYFREAGIAQMTGTGGLQRVPKAFVDNFLIPLPPLTVQQEIVAEIEGYQKVIDGARAVLDHYRPHIPIDPEWPMGKLADVCTLVSGQHIDKDDYNQDGIGIGYLTGPADFGIVHPSVSKWTTKPKAFAEKGDILITVKGSGLGKVNMLDVQTVAISRQLMAVRVQDALPQFIYTILLGKYDEIQSLGGGAAIPGITREDVLNLAIPLPPLATQQAIVAEIEAEQALVNANRELITRFEKKIGAVLARVWGEGEPVLVEG